MGALFMVPSPVIDAAVAILADGKARTADEILAIGVKRGLFAGDMTRKRVYTALSQYVERAAGRGRKSRIVEDVQHRFRLNHTPDDWPDLDVTGLPSLTAPAPVSSDAQKAIDSLRQAAQQTDPTAFEIAVCEAFNHLGFIATHVGGTGQPDGYADALLGPLAYRIMIECKLSADIGDSHSASAAEATKFKRGIRERHAGRLSLGPRARTRETPASHCIGSDSGRASSAAFGSRLGRRLASAAL